MSQIYQTGEETKQEKLGGRCYLLLYPPNLFLFPREEWALLASNEPENWRQLAMCAIPMLRDQTTYVACMCVENISACEFAYYAKSVCGVARAHNSRKRGPAVLLAPRRTKLRTSNYDTVSVDTPLKEESSVQSRWKHYYLSTSPTNNLSI